MVRGFICLRRKPKNKIMEKQPLGQILVEPSEIERVSVCLKGYGCQCDIYRLLIFTFIALQP
jgi:hypothetical protein